MNMSKHQAHRVLNLIRCIRRLFSSNELVAKPQLTKPLRADSLASRF
jgi:hypothetical protein